MTSKDFGMLFYDVEAKVLRLRIRVCSVVEAAPLDDSIGQRFEYRSWIARAQ